MRRSGSATTRAQRGRWSSTRSATAAQQACAESSAAVGDASDEQVDTGVVRAGGVVAGQRVEVGAVDLPVAHRSAVEYAEAGDAAAVAVELGAEVGLR